MGTQALKLNVLKLKPLTYCVPKLIYKRILSQGHIRQKKIYDQKGAAKCSISVVGAIVRRVRDVTGI